jgi:hypothetical protein
VREGAAAAVGGPPFLCLPVTFNGTFFNKNAQYLLIYFFPVFGFLLLLA